MSQSIVSDFCAFVARGDKSAVTSSFETMTGGDLPAGEVTIRVLFSSANFKDALALTPGSGVVREYPIVPGIDLAGEVLHSESDEFEEGQLVLAHGYDLGTGVHGGYSEIARVPHDWVVPLDGLDARESMIIGTAGFTAALSVQALENHGVTPGSGPILVTGASGGVGSISVDLLSSLGYEVVASTSKPAARDLLKQIGAAEVIGRLPEDAEARIPALGGSRWAGVVDSAGGRSLAYALSTTTYGGAVAASGLTAGAKLETTVMPFILRGVGLQGIDSVKLDIESRRALWARLGGEMRPKNLEAIARDHKVKDVLGVLSSILDGTHSGRSVIEVSGGFPG